MAKAIQGIAKSSPSLVDLFTTDRDLDSFMIDVYPHVITGEQHNIDGDGDGKVYQFFNLKWQELEPFLKEHVLGHEYEIRDSKSGDIVRVESYRTVSQN